MSGPLPSWSGGLTSSSMLACLLACVALNDKKSERQASQRFGWGCLMLRARGNNKQNKKGKTGAMYGLYDFWFAFSTQGGRVRVVKELDLKSNGPCPRRFKSCRPRLTLLFFFSTCERKPRSPTPSSLSTSTSTSLFFFGQHCIWLKKGQKRTVEPQQQATRPHRGGT